MIDAIEQTWDGWRLTGGPERLMWIFAHSLWQSALLAAGLWLLLRGLPARSAASRYAVSILTLPLLIVAMTFTWSVLGWPDHNTQATHPASSPPSSSAWIAPNPQTLPGVQINSHTNISPKGETTTLVVDWQLITLILWATTATALLLRITLQYLIGRRRLTTDAQPASTSIHALARRVRRQLKFRRAVQINIQPRCIAPCVLGVVKPIILLPPSALTGLSPDQLEAVLAHELAHAKRFDALIDLGQRLLTSLLFFNPALYWLNHQIRQEREACCDQTASRVVGNELVVAQALQTLAQLALKQTPERPAETTISTVPLHQQLPALAASDGNLHDRVRRLLEPAHNPRILLSWPVALVMLTFSSAGLLILERGTDATIAYADKILNPEAYVEATRALVETNTQPQPRLDENRQVIEADQITVSGTITTHDGKPLTGNSVSVTVNSERERYSGSTSINAKVSEDRLSAAFKHDRLDPGMVRVIASAEGYAPATTSIRRIDPGDRWENIRLVLPEGRDLPVEVVDDQGKPVEGVALKPTQWIGNSSRRYGRYEALQTNQQGQAILPHIGDVDRLTMAIDTPGYEWHQAERLHPGQQTEAWRIVLTPARPVDGVVLDNTTGQPITNAEVHLVYRGHGGMDPRNAWNRKRSLITETDHLGRFTLDRLMQRTDQTIWIEAPGKQPELLMGVRGGDEPLTIRLKPALKLEVNLIGSLDRLRTNRDGEPVITFTQGFMVAQSHSYGGSNIEAVVTPNANGGQTVLDQYLLPGAASLSAGDRSIRIPSVAEAATNGPWVIDLNPQPTDPGREVVIRLVPPEGWPTPEGELEAAYHQQAGADHLGHGTFPIQNGEIRLTAHFNSHPHRESYVTTERLQAAGYWLPKPSHSDRLVLEPAPQAGAAPQVFALNVYPAGVITGQIIDDSGAAIPHARLSLHKIDEPEKVFNGRRTDPNWWNNLKADENGLFVIPSVPFGGTYRVEASNPAQSRYAWGIGQNITLAANQPQAEQKIVVPRGQDIRVFVTDANDDPVPEAESSLRRSTDHGGQSWSPNENADAQGMVTFKALNFAVPDAVYQITIPPINGHAGQTIPLSPTQDTYHVKLKRGRTLTGKLIHAETKQPIANATVTARQAYGITTGFQGRIEATTRADGTFALVGLDTLRYLLQVEDHYAAGSQVNRRSDGTVKSVTTGEWPTVSIVNETAQAPPFELRVIPSPW